MNAETILKELEGIAASITAQSGTSLRQGSETADESLMARGMDSLDYIDYLLAIEGKFGYRVSEQDIKEHDLARTASLASFLVRIVGEKKA